jgi:acetyl-CoA carboxylase carboxyl transferase subunit beta
MDIFLRFRPKHLTLPSGEEATVAPDNLWIRCPSCSEQIYERQYLDNLRVCPKCRFHFRLSVGERIETLFDPGSFSEMDANLRGTDPLRFQADGESYAAKLIEAERKAGTPEAAVSGAGSIEDVPVVGVLSNFAFQAGSLGVAVGEKIVRAVDVAVAQRLPLLIVSASGGARQHEGVFGLMQMAKTTAALSRLSRVEMPYISLLTDPTIGGVPASYAMLGDVMLAEPSAYIGFAGPRVMEKTLRQKLPPGMASSESMLAHGMIDLVCTRADLRATIARLLRLLTGATYARGSCRLHEDGAAAMGAEAAVPGVWRDA